MLQVWQTGQRQPVHKGIYPWSPKVGRQTYNDDDHDNDNDVDDDEDGVTMMMTMMMIAGVTRGAAGWSRDRVLCGRP